MLLFSTLVALCPAFVLVHPAGVVPQPQVVYHTPYAPPLVPVANPEQPHIIYHYGLGGVRPDLQPPVVLVRVVPGLPPPNQPPLQPPFIEEVPPVFKNPPPDPEDPPPAKKPSVHGRRGSNKPDCPEVDNKKGIAPPPTRKPSKKGRDAQTRKSRRPPAESTTKRPPNKANRRVNPKSERLRASERLTLAQNAQA
ncbi:hypothetical protein HPB50_010784 [Hyalomma asiaticum]|uniref:Uncharacterized protein n=1 Tax=Hyalomma asiaticum TaxID=266040 RepID=A0ACB7T976_HYAAI|nr:hypothetical protein HPB50_010784 [Hyalomma asiaticum]